MVLQRHPIYSGLSCRIFPKPFHIDMHPISLYMKAQLISHFTDISKYQTPCRRFTRTNLTGDMRTMPIRSESNQIKHHKTNDLKCARVRSTLLKSVECMKSEDE